MNFTEKLPKELAAEVFIQLANVTDLKFVLECTLVCKEWRNVILTSDHVLKIKPMSLIVPRRITAVKSCNCGNGGLYGHNSGCSSGVRLFDSRISPPTVYPYVDPFKTTYLKLASSLKLGKVDVDVDSPEIASLQELLFPFINVTSFSLNLSFFHSDQDRKLFAAFALFHDVRKAQLTIDSFDDINDTFTAVSNFSPYIKRLTVVSSLPVDQSFSKYEINLNSKMSHLEDFSYSTPRNRAPISFKGLGNLKRVWLNGECPLNYAVSILAKYSNLTSFKLCNTGILFEDFIKELAMRKKTFKIKKFAFLSRDNQEVGSITDLSTKLFPNLDELSISGVFLPPIVLKAIFKLQNYGKLCVTIHDDLLITMRDFCPVYQELFLIQSNEFFVSPHKLGNFISKVNCDNVIIGGSFKMVKLLQLLSNLNKSKTITTNYPIGTGSNHITQAQVDVLKIQQYISDNINSSEANYIYDKLGFAL